MVFQSREDWGGGEEFSHERIIGFSRGEDRAEGKRGRKVSEKKHRIQERNGEKEEKGWKSSPY